MGIIDRIWQRVLLFIAGVFVAFPNWESSLIGAALAAFAIAMIQMSKRRTAEKLISSE